MNAKETSILTSGQAVGLAVKDFQKEITDFGALQAADKDRAELVTAVAEKEAAQDAETQGATTAKEQAREEMAVAADVLSARAVGYALAAGELGLKRDFTLTYADVRYGEATEDVNHVRDLVAKVAALPALVRKNFRLTDAVIQAPLDAAEKFEKAEDTQSETKTAPRLATLELPELLRKLSKALLLMKTLIYGQRLAKEAGFDWAGLNTAFANANKRRVVAAKRRGVDTGVRIVRTLHVTIPAGHAGPSRLHNTNYGPAYTLTVENRGGAALVLWMAQRDGTRTTFGTCPAGVVTALTRRDIGPDTARYLMGEYAGGAGGAATVVVRRVV